MTTPDPRQKYSAPGKSESPQAFPGLEAKMNTKPDYGLESYRGTNRLKGKKAVVTGGDSGIGRAVAVAYAREGADVLITYLTEEESDAKETLQAIEATGRKGVGVVADFRDLSTTKNVIETAVTELGGIDILINNAALQKHFETLEAISAEDFEEIFRINVVAPFRLTQLAAPHLAAGSAVINTVSIQAFDPSFSLLPYATSKGALTEMTKALADHLIERGIRVNAVAPGPIWSPLNTHGAPKSALKKFGENTSIGRPGQPVELAPLYVLLASDEGSYLTGEVFGVTGGKGIV